VLAEKYQDRITKIRSKYPDLRSTVMPLLYLAQEEYGGLNQNALREVAELCDLDPTEVKTIAGFYTMYWEEDEQAEHGHGYKGDGKKGKYWLQVCTDLPCALRGADAFHKELKAHLGVEEGGTTEDGLFTVEHVMCLAACDKAPMLQCNFHFVENLNMDIMKEKLEQWRAEAANPPAPVVAAPKPARRQVAKASAPVKAAPAEVAPAEAAMAQVGREEPTTKKITPKSLPAQPTEAPTTSESVPAQKPGTRSRKPKVIESGESDTLRVQKPSSRTSKKKSQQEDKNN
jgi:NADH:ubiquinone oxidoreductase subunit E